MALSNVSSEWDTILIPSTHSVRSVAGRRTPLWPGTALGVEATVVNKTGENGTLYWEVRPIKLAGKQSNHRILVTITNNNANSDSDKKISALTDKMARVCLLF